MALEKLTKIGDKTISEIAEEILEIVRNEDTLNDCFGIRWDKKKFKVGANLHKSHLLYQDQEYDHNDNPIYPEGKGRYKGYYDAGELNGTSSIGIDYHDTAKVIEKKIEYSLSYSYENTANLYLIQGDNAEGGADIEEWVITNAKVRVAY